MKPNPFLTPALISLFMIASISVSALLKPNTRMADTLPPLDLMRVIPEQFSGWRVDENIIPISQSADVKTKLETLYSQTLARTYINAKGQRIMLSIAYGADQSGDANQVHRPEFCYAAQGFQLISNRVGELSTQYGSLPVRRLLAVQGLRNEPITYWVTIGETATLPGLNRKLNQIRYGLSGTIPDGMLVRVSSIDNNNAVAYKLHESFIEALLLAIPSKDRLRISGKFGA